MAKRVFKAILSVESIENLKKDLIQYKKDVLNEKCKRLVSELANRGYVVASTHVGMSPVGGYVSLRVNEMDFGNGRKALLIMNGSVHESPGREPFYVALAVEFGSGIYYNASGNPNAGQFGLGPGTFPGQIHAFEDGWYFWDENSQHWRYTHGIKATMPMYNAQKTIREEFMSIARKVFG